MSNVQLGYTQVIDPISFKSIPSGKIYIGEYGTLPNPANAGTWKQAYFVNSDGTRTAASQPIRTNAAGYAVDVSGNVKHVEVYGLYSILVQDQFSATKFSLAFGGTPSDAQMFTVDAIAEVDATSLPDGLAIFAKGRTDVGDGGGGIFRYVSGSVQAVDGGLVFAPSVGSGRFFRDGWSSGGFLGSVNVRWFGAKGDGITDDTAAFTSALAANKHIFVPKGTYVGTNIPAVGGMTVEGEGGENGLTTLDIAGNNASFFLADTTSGDIYNIFIRGIRVKNSGAYTGTTLWKQTSNTNYTAYAEFYDVEIEKSVSCGFRGFFIYADWIKCRSGYNGASTDHKFIESLPAAFGQSKQTNLCRVIDSRIFGCTTSGTAAVDIAYGARWDFFGTDFENMDAIAIRSRGIYGGSINGCWMENVRGTNVLQIDISPAPNAQGSRPWSLTNSFVNLTNGSGTFALVGNSSTLEVGNLTVVSNPTNGVMYSGNGTVTVTSGLSVLSGDTTSFNNRTVIAAPFFPNNNVLMFGVYGVAAARLTNNGFTSIADAASLAGNPTNTARLTLSAGANAAYYTVPAKVLDYLKGKKVRVTAMGSFVASGGAEFFQVATWDSIGSPAFGNKTNSANIVASTSTTLSSVSFETTVGASATSFSVGVSAGGGASGSVFVLETLQIIVA